MTRRPLPSAVCFFNLGSRPAFIYGDDETAARASSAYVTGK